ncbi:uncharacterized protein LOC131164357 [Malania oleifera]|uniref:uncharacterized protein LOC131164357 n=1 Tax=Malania oleifera TaxID=397392 RepID=UPI0025ADEE6C|nr:uncharacterized protein LOC131164357 [Malania oleifera]
MQIFPLSVRKLWHEWELRMMILLSLSLQIVLIVFGKRRKHDGNAWVRILVWMTYLSADWLATVCLGTLSSNQGDSFKDNFVYPSDELKSFWAPFLLLHLGGPDTITAYSLEDNELWLRHLLGLVVQVAVVFYVYLTSWTRSGLTFLTIPVLIAGIIKYAERTWVLRSASSKHFRDSLLPPPDAGPDYAALMEKISAREAQRLPIRMSMLIEPLYFRLPQPFTTEAGLLYEGYFLFKMFKRLYADLILSFHDKRDSDMSISSGSPQDAFKLVEIELGFMFDVLYTKATIIHSRFGVFLRCITFLSCTFTLLAFWIIIDKHAYPKTDITITYLLLIGSVFLEIHAVIILIFSDWTKLWLTKHKEAPLANLISRAISSSRLVWAYEKRWSGFMAQYNLLDVCLRSKLPCDGVQKLLGIHEMLEQYSNKTWEKVTVELKELIFEHLTRLEHSTRHGMQFNNRQRHASRGPPLLQSNNYLDKFSWSLIDQVEFDESLLLWHIATDLCYHSDLHKYQNDIHLNPKCKISKSLSNYMLYLLIICPFMVPKGIGEIRLRDTCAEAIRFLQQRRGFISSDRSNARMLLLQVNIHRPPSEMKGDRSKSLLFNGCRLAKQLQSLVTEDRWDNEEKWAMISNVWVAMLSYAAIRCRWKHHGQQLRRGGELLSHVCLLMAHLGMSEQFQIQRGHARVGVH